jgi:hypothetical protein
MYFIKNNHFPRRFQVPNPDQPEPRCGYSKQVENTSIGPGPRRFVTVDFVDLYRRPAMPVG